MAAAIEKRLESLPMLDALLLLFSPTQGQLPIVFAASGELGGKPVDSPAEAKQMMELSHGETTR